VDGDVAQTGRREPSCCSHHQTLTIPTPHPSPPNPPKTKTRELTEESERSGITADKVADVVADALTAKRPRDRYLVGSAPTLHNLRRFLPGGVFNNILNNYYFNSK
jgi:hypothetical protein